jgi:hypothetical protein
MTVKQQDAIRILGNIRKASNWENDLVSANDLFHLGPKKFEDAVKRYGKILEVLLRLLYKEISMIVPPNQKQTMVLAENKISEGKKAIGNFGLGQLIALFSKSGLFNLTKKCSGFDTLDPAELNKINSFRIDQTHYFEDIVRSQVDEIKKYTTGVLLQFGLITRDPEKVLEIQKEAKEPDVRQQRMEGMQHVLRKIRLELIEKEKIELNYPLDRGDGWYGDVQTKAEILGVCIGKDETFTVFVRVLEVLAPIDEEEDAYQSLGARAAEIIADIVPETKEKLRILFFDERNGSRFESACAYWTIKEGLIFL